MSKNSDPEVSFTTETINECICPQCPVQGKSQCVKDKMGRRTEGEARDFPGVYCSTGIAGCRDLDTRQICICGGCQVFEKYNLAGRKPMFYYCRDGMAN
ncbi:MAG TPA: DUF2769 domain-containing protein [candidate division Zixibacteria bacterium]|nr:DUF2769 domain-containing protein [candidate division Zixibacteria bacterium]